MTGAFMSQQKERIAGNKEKTARDRKILEVFGTNTNYRINKKEIDEKLNYYKNKLSTMDVKERNFPKGSKKYTNQLKQKYL